jgi:hypothetical protein
MIIITRHTFITECMPYMSIMDLILKLGYCCIQILLGYTSFFFYFINKFLFDILYGERIKYTSKKLSLVKSIALSVNIFVSLFGT